MIRNLTNVGGTAVRLNDLNGLVIEAGATVNGLAFEEAMLINSVDVAVALLNDTLTLSDGTVSYARMGAINFLKGLSAQYTKDGKPITTVSDRPKDFYRHFTGRGDDKVTGKIGEGPMIHMVAAAGETATIDAHFIDDVYVRDGEVSYVNAGFDSHLNIEVICPAGIPFPSPTKTGTLDLTATGFVPNLTGTGAFMTAPVEVKLFRFLNAFHLVGNESSKGINSPEPFMMNTPYFLRYTLTADPDIIGSLKAAVTMGMFRKKTV